MADRSSPPLEFASFVDVLEMLIYRPDAHSWDHVRVAWLLLMADALRRVGLEDDAADVRARALRIVHEAIDDTAGGAR